MNAGKALLLRVDVSQGVMVITPSGQRLAHLLQAGESGESWHCVAVCRLKGVRLNAVALALFRT